MREPIRTRCDFCRAGFRLEWKDGAPVLYCAKDWEGRPDWQAFKSREHMVVWIAAGIAEMEQEEVMAELDAKRAALTALAAARAANQEHGEG
jgi:phage terminase Nu1 subunit (DNA packaging protein)